MPFERPRPARVLDKQERTALLADYLDHYRAAAKADPTELNRKLPREAVESLLDAVGRLLLDHAVAAAATPGPVRDFLDANPLPAALEDRLPDDFRAYCLLLNGLKQWLAAEQAATDRYLLGGKARQECRAAATACVVTGEPLAGGEVELHHPVRDGRPPVPLSKRGHDLLEGQAGAAASGGDGVRAKLVAIRREMGRSWVHLRRGCLDLLGREVTHSTPGIAANSKSFARKVAAETGLTFEQLLAWLDENRLG